MNIHKLYRPFLVHFRRSRMQRFVELFSIGEQTTVLDLGFCGITKRLIAVSKRPPLQ